jgi:hypothetical protein
VFSPELHKAESLEGPITVPLHATPKAEESWRAELQWLLQWMLPILLLLPLLLLLLLPILLLLSLLVATLLLQLLMPLPILLLLPLLLLLLPLLLLLLVPLLLHLSRRHHCCGGLKNTRLPGALKTCSKAPEATERNQKAPHEGSLLHIGGLRISQRLSKRRSTI